MMTEETKCIIHDALCVALSETILLCMEVDLLRYLVHLLWRLLSIICSGHLLMPWMLCQWHSQKIVVFNQLKRYLQSNLSKLRKTILAAAQVVKMVLKIKSTSKWFNKLVPIFLSLHIFLLVRFPQFI